MSARYPQGQRMFDDAKARISGGVNRMNLLDDPGNFPVFFERASGPWVFDVDGRKYIDLIAGKAAVVLGYGDDRIDGAVRRAIDDGVMMPLMHPRYAEGARLLSEAIPSMDLIKFFRTGSCAVSAAVRLCRVFTGRRKILTCGYHGWHEWFVEHRRSYPMEDAEVVDFHYDLDVLDGLAQKYRHDLAAIVVTPEPALHGLDFCSRVDAIAQKAGCLWTLDEMKTCFRFTRGGYQAMAGVRPDLTCVGKAIANGYALSALGGRADVMGAEERTNVSGTYETEAVGLAAGIAMMDIARTLDFDVLERMYRRFTTDIEEALARQRIVARCAASFGNAHLVFEDDATAIALYRAAAERGVTFYCFDDINLMFAHETIFDDMMARIKEAIAMLPVLGQGGTLSQGAFHRYLTRHRICSKQSKPEDPVCQRMYRHLMANGAEGKVVT